MGNFISPNPKQNSKVEDAVLLLHRRRALGLNALDVVAIDLNGKVVEFKDFDDTEIKNYRNGSLALYIRTQPGSESDEHNPIGRAGEFINVGLTLQMVAAAPNFTVGLARMFAVDYPGISPESAIGIVQNRLRNLPGVAEQMDTVLQRAWDSIKLP